MLTVDRLRGLAYFDCHALATLRAKVRWQAPGPEGQNDAASIILRGYSCAVSCTAIKCLIKPIPTAAPFAVITCISFVLLSYSAIVVPMQLSFWVDSADTCSETLVMLLDAIVDSFFLVSPDCTVVLARPRWITSDPTCRSVP